jgi:hypothetical protein
MEHDKRLREILLNSADGASADFTDAVMKRVHNIPAASYYQPLVSPKLKRAFILVFSTTVAAIVGLSLIIALVDSNIIESIMRLPLPGINYNQVLLFLFIFWGLFGLNILFQNSFQVKRNL